jgi:hypothetical protein
MLETDIKVIATFFDTREATKVYQYLRAAPVVLLRNSRPVSVQCSPVTKAELHAVSYSKMSLAD